MFVAMDSAAAVQSVCKTFCTSFYKSLRAAKYMPVKASAPPPPLAFFFFLCNSSAACCESPSDSGRCTPFALMNIYHRLHSDREAGATFSHNEWLIWRIVQPSPVSLATSLYSNRLPESAHLRRPRSQEKRLGE